MYMGIYIRDTASGEEWWSHLLLPQSLYRFFAKNKKVYIAQGELTVAVAAMYTFPEELKGRAVMHFIDNTTALSAIVNGYASKSDCAVLVNCYHEAIVSLQSDIWTEWLPSSANI